MTKAKHAGLIGTSIITLTIALVAGTSAAGQAPSAATPNGQDVNAAQPVPGDKATQSPIGGIQPPASADGSGSSDSAEIVVTGTSIRGVAPVGANLVSVTRSAIESTGAQTVQQILRTVPSITTRSGSSVPAGGSSADNSYFAPSIHSLGASASNATLIQIDGHRIPLGGLNHAQPDPNILPPIALERVEVLAEGASSTYGSDAVAGVVNFITRRKFDGAQVTGQVGFARDYRTYTAGAIWGTGWDSGNMYVAYNYSHQDAIRYGHGRDFLQPNHIDEGGTNFQSFNCAPATIQPQGSSVIYLSPMSATTVANSQANTSCDTTVYGDLTPSETRHSAYVKLTQDVGDKLTVTADFVYGYRKTDRAAARGGIQATVFRTGTQANPFYVNPPGVVAGTTAGDRQTIRWQADDLLGPGAKDLSGADTWYGTVRAEYRLDDNFRITALGLIGNDKSYSIQRGQLCTSCAFLALNGTTASGGSLTTPSIPGTTTIITTLPLTAANALDVWTTGSANRTSAAVLARLTDSISSRRGENRMRQFRVGIDGALFELPAGPVRVAVGAEYFGYNLDTAVDRPTNTGPSSTGNASVFFPLKRSVKSAYGEVLVPIVSPEMEVPLAHRIDINISGRYDDYSDVGSTKNPKIAANWEVVEGVKLRGNWSKSFVAPSLRSLGNETGLYNDSGYTSIGEVVNVPIASFPNVTQIPGIVCNAVTCQIGGTIQGIRITNGNTGLKPQKGKTYSLGVDLAPRFLPGARLSVTWFNNKLKGGVTSPNLTPVVNTRSLNNLIVFYPNGATAADIAAAVGNVPQTGALPSPVYYINDYRQRNVLNLTIQGLDIEASYNLPTSFGALNIGGNVTRFLKYDEAFGSGTTFKVLNTTGFNTTFPSIKTTARGNIGLEAGNLSADIFANYVGAYRNYSGTTIVPVTLVNGTPTGGGDKVKAYTTIDTHISYKFDRVGFLSKSEVYVDVTNIFDRDPPFYNIATGYDSYGASPLGRLISVGLRASF